MHDGAEVVRPRDRPVVVFQVWRRPGRGRCAEGVAHLVVIFDRTADLQRTVVVDQVGAPYVGMVLHRGVIAVVAAVRGLLRVTRIVTRRVLEGECKAIPVRRVVADVVTSAGVPTALRLGQVTERPQVGGRQYRGQERRRVTEDPVQVVLRHQELAHDDPAPAALQADECFAGGNVRPRVHPGIAADA